MDRPALQTSLDPVALAFERNPSVEAWQAVHRRMSFKTIDARSRDAIVGAIANNDVPPRVVAAVAVDLSTYAQSQSFATVRDRNLRAVRSRSPHAVERTAHLAWSMLALRATYVTDPIDLSQMDLRDGARFVGRSMNLQSVNFSGARLSPAFWQDCNLTRAAFARARAAGRLTCDRCIWEPGGAAMRKTLVRGRWLS